MTDIEPLLVAYVDGELDAAAVAEVERLLAGNEDARKSIAIYRETATLLRAACAESAYADPSPPVRRDFGTSRAAPWRRRLTAVAAVLLLAIGFGSGWLVGSGSDEDGFVGDVAEYHQVYSHETTHLAEVPASQAAEIGAWLGARVRRAIEPPDLRAEGLRFAGARMLVSNGTPVADLLYTRAGGLPVALCVMRADEDGATASSGITVTTSHKLRVAYWKADGFFFAVVGDLTDAQAREIAEHARPGV